MGPLILIVAPLLPSKNHHYSSLDASACLHVWPRHLSCIKNTEMPMFIRLEFSFGMVIVGKEKKKNYKDRKEGDMAALIKEKKRKNGSCRRTCGSKNRKEGLREFLVIPKRLIIVGRCLYQLCSFFFFFGKRQRREEKDNETMTFELMVWTIC